MTTTKHPHNHSAAIILSSIILAMLLVATAAFRTSAATNTQNIILFIGDGMGQEHVIAGGMFANGAAGTLSFEGFPYTTTMTHNNASNNITDSAAGATAFATGQKVFNTVISIASPGDGSELTTLLELHQATGKRAGLVTTSYMTDATPAAFGAHTASRIFKGNIANDYVTQTRPNVLFGGGGNSFSTTDAVGAGYTLVSDVTGLLALNTATETYVAGIFGNDDLPPAGTPGRDTTLPTLPDMTQSALDILSTDPDGFFLVIEHEGTDTESHSNNETGMVRSAKELSDAVQVAINWMATNPNTLIVVTADHETGGLAVTETNPQVGVVPAVTWSTLGHTADPVPLYAIGPDADQIDGTPIDNVDLFEILRPETPPPTAVSQANITTSTAYPTQMIMLVIAAASLLLLTRRLFNHQSQR